MPNSTGFESAFLAGRDPRSFSVPWALQAACALDSCCPNLLAHIVYASDCKRQPMFCALAGLDADDPGDRALRLRSIDSAERTTPDPLAQIGHALIALKPRDIIRGVFGEVPDGFIGSLGSGPV